MDRRSTQPSDASGCFAQIGFTTIFACGTLLVLGLTILFPPWVEVRSQKRQVLYWSTHVRDYEQTFVGFDWLFADAKSRTIGPPTQPMSEQFFDVTEFRLYGPVLVAEWVAIGLVAIYLYVTLSRRLRIGRSSHVPKAESSDASNRPLG
jgi:hypothetical protein